MRELQAQLAHLTTPEFYNEQLPSEARVTAQHVFSSVPEILELIMREPSADELFRVQSVNRQFRDAVKGSKNLRTAMGLEAVTGCDFKLVEWFGYEFSLGMTDDVPLPPGLATAKEDGAAEHWTSIVVQFRSIPLKIGSRRREVLICQPPITKMRAYATCCAPRNQYQKPILAIEHANAVVKNEDGITIGDLYDAAEELEQEHKGCVNAHWRCHDMLGNVEVGVVFHGPVRLREGDGIVRYRKAEAEQRARQKAAGQTYRLHMMSFVAAKQTGKSE